MYSAEILISNLTEVSTVSVEKYADLWPDTLNAPDARTHQKHHSQLETRSGFCHHTDFMLKISYRARGSLVG
jgi:hypothetical protein